MEEALEVSRKSDKRTEGKEVFDEEGRPGNQTNGEGMSEELGRRSK